MNHRLALSVLLSCVSLVSLAHAEPATTSATTQPATIAIDTSLAPEFAEYGAQVKAVADEWYPKIAAALPSDGFTTADHVTFVFDPKYDGVAATMNDRIVCSTKYFATHKKDLGAFVHELVHVVQHYTNGQRPGWLTEGIADYIRFYQYEPESNRPHPNAEKSTYHDSYRTTAAFLDWASRTYDPQLVVKLNEACRTAKYSDDLWKQSTGKTLETLGAEWKVSLAPVAPTTKP